MSFIWRPATASSVISHLESTAVSFQPLSSTSWEGRQKPVLQVTMEVSDLLLIVTGDDGNEDLPLSVAGDNGSE